MIWNKEMLAMKDNERFSDTRKGAGLEMLGYESKYIFLCRQKDPVRNSKAKRANWSFQLYVDLKYLGTTLTN
jgi:hypothetical protein